jgi:hypothetical protein
MGLGLAETKSRAGRPKRAAGKFWFGRPASRLRVARYGGRRKVAAEAVALAE